MQEVEQLPRTIKQRNFCLVINEILLPQNGSLN